MRSYLVEVAFEVAVEVVVVGRHAGFTTGAKLSDREHVVITVFIPQHTYTARYGVHVPMLYWVLS